VKKLQGRFGEHFVDGFPEEIDFNGFGQKTRVGRVSDFGENIRGGGLPAHEDNGGVSGRAVAAEVLEEMGSGVSGHVIIEKDQLGFKTPTDFHAFDRIVGALDDMVLSLESHREKLYEVGVVIDDQDLRHRIDSIGSREPAVKVYQEEFCRN